MLCNVDTRFLCQYRKSTFDFEVGRSAPLYGALDTPPVCSQSAIAVCGLVS